MDELISIVIADAKPQPQAADIVEVLLRDDIHTQDDGTSLTRMSQMSRPSHPSRLSQPVGEWDSGTEEKGQILTGGAQKGLTRLPPHRHRPVVWR